MPTQQEITKYCSKCGSRLENRSNFKICPSCGKHFYFNAKPCVVIWLKDSRGEVLLTKRARDPFKGWWDVPGGFVEENETLEEAIDRELKEETGLKAENISYVGSFYEQYPFDGDEVPVVVAVFKGNVKHGSTVKVADDVSDYKFLSINEVDFSTIAFENKRNFLKKLK